ncbi:hypothetical protein Poli38472_003854 [Pythium oligandrum]|uniref:Bidirectional sugar transporter SWEET n=1 Tax=Pythium oligandrum TaxID=41045 RepID=A0A8K1FMA6_PYTOL|nr:hypothetical protein Poli38472_003854 [Pythium oligandrum]|eukprot:TMW66089.1 hypothetical protein Poli38472_003854 [Pythium oligandrum]
MGSDVFTTVIKVLASISAMYMCLSPSTSLYKIHKQRSTGLASVVPLVALWACSHMWFLYGYVTDDVFPLMVTYIIGDVADILFIAVFYRWCSAKRKVIQAFVIALIINAIVTLYAVLGKRGLLGQSFSGVKVVVGSFATASSILLYASPFATISLVVKSKSSASIPFAMVLVGLVNNTLWIIYGFLLHDPLLIIPAVISLTIGTIQFVLYFCYQPKRQKPGAGNASVEVLPDVLPAQAPQSATVGEKNLTSSVVLPMEGELKLPELDVDRLEAAYSEVRSPSTMTAVPLAPTKQ